MMYNNIVGGIKVLLPELNKGSIILDTAYIGIPETLIRLGKQVSISQTSANVHSLYDYLLFSRGSGVSDSQ